MNGPTPLDPTTAANLAKGVYGIIEVDNVAEGLANQGVYNLLKNSFQLSSGTIAQGKSGIGTISRETGFAMFLQGTGARKNELAIVTRGTVTRYDWLSNIHIASTRGPGGYSVHTGFNNIFTSISNELKKISGLKFSDYSHIHCVGHSLGGALANLFAAKLTEEKRSVSLYTFGSPRVGMKDMSVNLESKLNPNIYRVYNQADPVPLIPIYPYMHSPHSKDGMCVTNCGVLFSVKAHDMDTYTKAVNNHSWNSLASAATATPLHVSVDYWLDMASEYVKFPGSSIAMSALGKALNFLLDLARATIGIGTTIVTTIADKVAMLLAQAANTSKAIGERLLRLMNLILKFAGKAIITTTRDITKAFLQWVLDLIIRPILSIANRAIQIATR